MIPEARNTVENPSPAAPERAAQAAGESGPALERKSIDFAVKSLDDGPSGNGRYSIYAASFNNLDRANEVIAPGAFENLDDFVHNGFMALNHRWDQMPIATISSARMDQRGLLVEGEFHSTPEAQAARTTMRERFERGKSVRASIGYQVTKDEKIIGKGNPYRLLKGIQIFELSWVNVPANEQAVAVAIKGLDAMPEVKSDSAMSEGDDAAGGSTVPADEGKPKGKPPAVGSHVEWKAYSKGMVAGCGAVKSMHKEGSHGGFEASESSPVALVTKCMAMKGDEAGETKAADKASPSPPCPCSGKPSCGCEKGDKPKPHTLGKTTAYHPVDQLSKAPGETESPSEDADEDEGAESASKGATMGTVSVAVDTTQLDAALAKVKALAEATIRVKGAYLGDTDELMTAAALDRLHSMLGYYLFACVRSDKPLDAVLSAASGAIDEYKETALKLFSSLLEDESDEDEADEPIVPAVAPLGGPYAYMGDHATRYLAKLARLDTSRDNAVSALSLEEKSRVAVSAAGEVLDVSRRHFALRKKEGRALSSATRSRIRTVLDGITPLVTDLEALLAETEPKPKNATESNSPPTADEAMKNALESGVNAAKASPAPSPESILSALADFARFEFESTCGVG